MRDLRPVLLLAALLMPVSACAAVDGVVCALQPSSIVSRSPSGVAQVSNVGDIQVRCSVPAKHVDSTELKPGEVIMPVRANSASATLLLPGGARKEVSAEVSSTVGSGDDQTHAWVEFYLHLPLDPPERDAEARRSLARLESEIDGEKSQPQERVTDEERQRRVSKLGELVSQHRVGYFRVECHLTQGDQSLGAGEVTFEVLYKARFSDLFPPTDPAK